MKKAIITGLVLAVGGGVLYVAAQAAVPASRSQQEKAAQLLQNIQLVPASNAAQPAPAASPAGDEPATKPSQIEAQRNHYLQTAIESLDGELNKLVCARAALYQQKALEQQQAVGAAPEKWLLDQLQQQNGQLLTTTTQRGGFTGDADSQAAGRQLTVDTLAILKALQQVYNNQSKSCISEPYQASEFISAYLIRANQHRSALEQQAQQSQSQAEVAKNGQQN